MCVHSPWLPNKIFGIPHCLSCSDISFPLGAYILAFLYHLGSVVLTICRFLGGKSRPAASRDTAPGTVHWPWDVAAFPCHFGASTFSPPLNSKVLSFIGNWLWETNCTRNWELLIPFPSITALSQTPGTVPLSPVHTRLGVFSALGWLLSLFSFEGDWQSISFRPVQ